MESLLAAAAVEVAEFLKLCLVVLYAEAIVNPV